MDTTVKTLLIASLLLPLSILPTRADTNSAIAPKPARLSVTSTPAPKPTSTPDPEHPVSSVLGETKAQRDARMAWWREAKFGLFIHWGIYSIPANGEWYMNRSKTPVATYAKNAAAFNPTKFDAQAWVAAAKQAGMKYVVITAKHHDGFSLFATKATDFNIMDATPFKRDVIKELSAACQADGMKFGIYYSHGQDWHHPGGGVFHGSWDRAQQGDNDRFVNTIVIPQLHELLNNYPLDLVWWDSSVELWSHNFPNRAARLYEEFKPFPKLIINNRLYDENRKFQFESSYWKPLDPLEYFIRGDYATPEGKIPPSPPPAGIDWETCNTMNNAWGYRPSSDSNKTKSTKMLIRMLVDCASKGGNFLLNVGPRPDGQIDKECLDRLAAVGQWMKINGQAIYGTTATPFDTLMGSCDPVKKDKEGKPIFNPEWKWRATSKPGHVYLTVFAWPDKGSYTIPVLKQKITGATLLANPAAILPVSQDDKGTTISGLPQKAPDAVASVIDLKY